MGQPIARYRLSDEPRDFGLSCSAQGLSLAGVPLLKRAETGFRPRLASEIERLIGQAYRGEVDPAAIMSGLGAIARALDDGQIARAMIGAVLLKVPDLDWDGAVRIARAEDALLKAGYREFESRNSDGEWADSDGSQSAGYSHHYVYRTLVCSRSGQHCSAQDAWDGLLRNAYPGQDPMKGPIQAGGGDYNVYGEPNGPIHSTPDATTMTVTNEAKPGHIFYPGTVTRSVIDAPEGIYIQTEGHGHNSSIVNWVENHVAGYYGFQAPDTKIGAYMKNPGFYDRTKR